MEVNCESDFGNAGTETFIPESDNTLLSSDVTYSTEPSKISFEIVPISDDEAFKWKQEIDSVNKLLEIDKELEDQKILTLESEKKTVVEDELELEDPPNINQILAKSKNLKATWHNTYVLNKACQKILTDIEEELTASLEKNRKEQTKIMEYLNFNKKESEEPEYQTNAKIKCVGYPYFKDLNGYPAPRNEDILSRIRNHELLPVDILTPCHAWNPKDTELLKNAVYKNALDFKIQKLLDQKSGMAEKSADNLGIHFEIIENEIKNLKDLPLTAIDVDECKIDWMKISVIDMKGKYSDNECESKWTLNLSPKINKSKWSATEVKKLEELARKYNYENWDAIAVELGTNRTGFQCCIKYQSKKVVNEGKWTEDEDKKLMNLIKQYKVKDHIPWAKVSWYFETRTLRQCQERYMYHLCGLKKGVFNKNEDMLIVFYAKKYRLDFGKVAKHLEDRSVPQVRARFEYLVCTQTDPFTAEEDRLLTNLVRVYPKNWDKISEFFENRSALQCRKRWSYLKKKNLFNFDDIANVSNEVKTRRLSGAGNNFLSPHQNPSTSSSTIKKNLKMIKVENVLNSANRLYESTGSLLKRKPPKKGKKKQVMQKPISSISIYHQNLSEHLKYCWNFMYGPRLCNLANPSEVINTCDKTKVALLTLSAQCDLSLKTNAISEMLSNSEFSQQDVEVLNRLTEDQNRNEDQSKCVLYNNQYINKTLIPPNYINFLGLRSFELARSSILSSASDATTSSAVTTEEDGERLLFSEAKDLWKSRIRSLFTMPMICSNFTLGTSDVPVTQKQKKRVRVTKLKRKIHAKKMSSVYHNKQRELGKEKPKETKESDVEKPKKEYKRKLTDSSQCQKKLGVSERKSSRLAAKRIKMECDAEQ